MLTSSTPADMAFRLLDLPAELRLMVYDCISTVPFQHSVRIGGHTDGDAEPRPLSIYTRQTLQTAILGTCSNAEVGPIISKKLALIEEQPLRIQLHMDDAAKEDVVKDWFPFTTGSSIPTYLFYKHWKHITPALRAPEHAPHLIIAATSNQGILSAEDQYLYWRLFWQSARSGNASCVVYHKGVLPRVRLRNGRVTTGMAFWGAIKIRWTSHESLKEGKGVEDYLTIKVLKEDEWDQMVEQWKEC